MKYRIRTASPEDAASIARVHINSWRTTYEGIVPAEFLANQSYADRESVWNNVLKADQPAKNVFVAEIEGGEVIGFAHTGLEREGGSTYPGELYAIYLLQEHQGCGIGRRLVSAAAQRLLDRGLHSMLLWVLEDNRPARSFYESLGGEQVGRKTINIGGKDVVEVCYGWRDISDISAGA